MVRILIANLIAEVLPLLLIAAGLILVSGARARTAGHAWRRTLGLSLLALPLGILAYVVAGIAAAAMRGDGHFFSVPFGGYSVSDNAAVGVSLLIWIALVFGLLAVMTRRSN